MRKMKFWKTSLTGACLATAIAGCTAPGGAATTHIVPDRVAYAQDVGALVATRPISLVMGVKIHDESLIPATIEQVRQDRARALTGADFADRFSVSKDAYAQLIDWAQLNNLKVTRATDARTSLTVEGSVADVEHAFNVHMRLFQDAKGVFYAPDHEPELSGVLGNVSSIVGLSDSNKWRSHVISPPPPLHGDGLPAPDAAQAIPTPYTLANLQALYYLPTGKTAPTGAGAQVAILGAGTPNGTTDLGADPNMFNYDVPDVNDVAGYLGAPSPLPNYTQIQVGPSSASDGSDTSGGGFVENTLDAEMVLTFAPAAQVNHVFVVSNGGGLFSDGIAYIVNDPSQAATHTVTVSYGSCERGSESEMPVLNALFAQAQTQGQQWFFASGDDGEDACGDGQNNPTANAGWPASSPYVIAVGGTELTITTGGSKKKPTATGARPELAWGGNGGGGGGGGPSADFPKPTWQTGTTNTDGARDLPDVSALGGDPGVDIFIAGKAYSSFGEGGVEGTSAATPMWAGIWALLDAQAGGTKGTGFSVAHVDLYNHAPTGAFTDITSGSNDGGDAFGGYSAKAGYDLATGLGSPNITNLLKNTGWK